MSSDGFGTLEDVDARSAWAHEAHVFTPWLADNLSRLGDAIGLPLELTAREQGVGRFSADIVARSLHNDAVVLVENQLERSDHTHLGQIMTYLAGTEAKVIVWLAPQFCEEHLSAIRWLNQHSHEEFSFFAVKLRVVRIGDSPLAPLFEVLEKPNEWERAVNQEVRAGTRGDMAVEKQAFWDAYAAIDPAVATERRTGPGGSNRWRSVPGMDLVVNRYKGKHEVGIFIRGVGEIGDDQLIEMMDSHLVDLARTLEAEPGQWSSFWKTRKVASGNESALQEGAEWLARETDRYVAALAQQFGEVGA